MIRPDVTEAISMFGDAPDDAHVVEIGPGMGALTAHLARREKLTLIEIEAKFCDLLSVKYPRAKIVNEDVRRVDFSQLGSNLFVFGNIPYVFSTEIIFHLIECRASVDCAVMMVQREFAERLAADHGSRTYGSITVAVQLWADVELGPLVPGTAFHPPTAVESQVMKLTFHKDPRVPVSDPVHFQSVVRAAFSQRRKKLVNSLAASQKWERKLIEETLETVGIGPDERPEQLSIERFALLADALPKKDLASI